MPWGATHPSLLSPPKPQIHSVDLWSSPIMFISVPSSSTPAGRLPERFPQLLLILQMSVQMSPPQRGLP